MGSRFDAEFRELHRTLRYVAHPEIDTPLWGLEDPSAVLWLRCESLTAAKDDQSRAQQQRGLEALELLARLASVDWVRCRTHILEIWKEGAAVLEFANNLSIVDGDYESKIAYATRLSELLGQQRFRIGVQVPFALAQETSGVTDISLLCDSIVTRGRFRKPSDQYRRLCLLIDQLSVDAKPTADAYVPVRLVQFDDDGGADISSLLAQVLHVAATQDYFLLRQSKPTQDVEGPRLRIDSLLLDRHAAAIDETNLRYITALHQLGVSCTALPELHHRPPREVVIESLQSLLETQNGSDITKCVEKMAVSTLLTQPLLSAHFSAMYASHSLRELSLRSEGNEDEGNY